MGIQNFYFMGWSMNQFEQYLMDNCNGRDNAIKSPELERIFRCKGTVIREMVNESRCRGIPICSDSKGYYYSSAEQDIAKTIANLSSRISNIEAARDGLRKRITK